MTTGADVDEVVARDVFERDGWLCQLCGGGVDGSLSFPEPGSASVDHIVPLSRGGSHTWENVQLAHLGCNMSKGARYGDGEATKADQPEEAGGDG